MDNWGHLSGFTDQLLPCLTNAMSLHHLTFQVSKNRSKEQSGATFTSRPQIYTQFFVPPSLSVCVQRVCLPRLDWYKRKSDNETWKPIFMACLLGLFPQDRGSLFASSEISKRETIGKKEINFHTQTKTNTNTNKQKTI